MKDSIFEKHSPIQLILELSLPAIVIMLVMVIYNMTDMFFIARLGDDRQVAAISLSSPVTLLFTTIGTLIGSGCCTFSAQCLGKRNYKSIETAMGYSAVMSISLGILLNVMILLCMSPILSILGCEEDTAPFVKNYLSIMAFGATFQIFSTAFMSIIRSGGDTKSSMIANLTGTALNMLLDPLFILIFHMGIGGAAFASVLGQIVTCIYLLIHMKKITGPLHLSQSCFEFPVGGIRTILLPLLTLGIPSAAGNLLMSFSNVIVNRYYISYGTDTITAFSAAGKSTMIIGMIALGVATGLQPALAYYVGSDDQKRLTALKRTSLLVSTLLCLILAVLAKVFSMPLSGLFTSDPQILSFASRQIGIYVLSAPFFGLYYLNVNLLQASGKAFQATLVTLLRQGLILIPTASVLNLLFGLSGLIWASVVSDILSTITSTLLTYLSIGKKQAAKSI